METREYTVYKFDELDEQGKEKVLTRYSDINVDHDWWDCLYDDAENIGLKITSFDSNDLQGDLVLDPMDVIRKVFTDHGRACGTYKECMESLLARHIAKKEGWFQYDEWADALNLRMRECYRITLRNEYEHLTSIEQVAETLRSNEYDFTTEGKID